MYKFNTAANEEMKNYNHLENMRLLDIPRMSGTFDLQML